MERPEHRGDDFSIRHPKMRREDRAKIFAPFAALSGYSDRAKTRERITRDKELSENSVDEVNTALQIIVRRLSANERVKAEVTYFEPDGERKGEGSYKSVSGYADKIDTYNKSIRINGLKIDFDRIYYIFAE